MVLQPLQQISILDGEDRLGKPTSPKDESTMNIPGLDDFLEYLISTDSSVNIEPVNISFLLSKLQMMFFNI